MFQKAHSIYITITTLLTYILVTTFTEAAPSTKIPTTKV